MPSSKLRSLIVGCGLWVCVSTSLAESPKTSQVLAQSKDLVANGAMDRAISLMESALEETPDVDYPAMVEQLRKFYVIAATQAKQSGRYDLADQYTNNLKVMDSANESHQTSGPAPDTVSATTPEVKIPKAVARHGQDEMNSPSVTKLAPISDRPSGSTNTANAPSNTKVQQFDLAEADTDFRAKKYVEACRIYQQLMDNNTLPESRRGHLAYCRSAALVERINKRPTDAGEWSSIQAELVAIQKIQPDFWFAEYLTDLVKERQNRQVAGGSTGGHPTAQLASNDGSAGMISRAANQIRSINPLRKSTR